MDVPANSGGLRRTSLKENRLKKTRYLCRNNITEVSADRRGWLDDKLEIESTIRRIVTEMIKGSFLTELGTRG
jgi:hypothetical protein